MQPNQRWIWAVVAVAFASCPVGAEAVDSIAAAVRPIVAQREISGAVTLLAGGADMLRLSAVGEADLASHRPMKRDDVLWIASLTNPLTGVTVLMLPDEGRLSMVDPVEMHGKGWGLGFQVVREPHGVTAMLAPGIFGHGGTYATQSWADPKSGLIYIPMAQRRGFPNGDDSDMRKAFQTAAAAFAVPHHPRAAK